MPSTASSPVAEALIHAGLQLLDQNDRHGLTLRRAAACAGVSHAAPAHHFGSLAGLETAIAARGFSMLCKALTPIVADAKPDADPFVTLMSAITQYLDFAHRHAALFRLMFARLPHDDAGLRAEVASAGTVLDQIAAPFCAGQDQMTVRTAIWAVTHGYAALSLGHPRPNAAAPAADCEQVMRLLLRR